jgi:hypothetical protein
MGTIIVTGCIVLSISEGMAVWSKPRRVRSFASRVPRGCASTPQAIQLLFLNIFGHVHFNIYLNR